jgi:hypothetical protein
VKPLPAAPLTEEDRQSNFAFVSRCRLSLFAAKLLLDSATADRRDAELMRMLIPGLPGGWDEPCIASLWIAGCTITQLHCGSIDPQGNITYCA